MNIGDMKPGDAIRLDDIAQLPAFEDMLALHIHPTMTATEYAAWVGRVQLRDLIRPPKFNGTIADVELVLMDEPYARLLDARERGWHIARGRNYRHTAPEIIVESFRGFTFLADAKSSGKGQCGANLFEP